VGLISDDVIVHLNGPNPSSSNMAIGSTEPRIRPWGSVTLTTWHYPQKLALTSPTSGGRSVGIFRSRPQATEFFF
jgi:hypothetical protein